MFINKPLIYPDFIYEKLTFVYVYFFYLIEKVNKISFITELNDVCVYVNKLCENEKLQLM